MQKEKINQNTQEHPDMYGSYLAYISSKKNKLIKTDSNVFIFKIF